MLITPNYNTTSPEHNHVTQGKKYKCYKNADGVNILDDNCEWLEIDSVELKKYWNSIE